MHIRDLAGPIDRLLPYRETGFGVRIRVRSKRKSEMRLGAAVFVYVEVNKVQELRWCTIKLAPHSIQLLAIAC